MKNKLIILFFLFGPTIFLYAQSDPPKREFRAAWIASVVNLDWPTSTTLTTEQQKQQLIDLLDGLKEIGINIVIFQIRSECDAMYPSDIEPWSYWLTGQQGKAPNPFYDPLEFAVEEAHKRGMEIHAWFNPYRADRDIHDYTVAPTHVTVQHPDWLLQFGTLKILDPGLPMVRDYVTSVITDVVRRYDIDGVHFDDYFYPYEGITNEDNSTFANYSRGFTNKANWRRDNVNIFVKQVYDSIQAVKPYVKFGISPFGIWKSGVPSGIVGLDAYSELYADAIAWLQQHSIDYLTPQLYWKFGGGQDYGKLMPWWADSAAANGRHLYPGLAAYRINGSDWSASELPNQVRANRNNPKVQGSVFFRALVGLLDNEKGFTDSLKNDLFKYPALLPTMSWKDTIKPNPVQNLRFERIESTARAGLKWDLPALASDGDTAVRYILYHLNSLTPQQSDFDDAKNILSIEGNRFGIPSGQNLNAPYYFAVTSLDRNYNESAPSAVVEISSPNIPALILPADNEINQRDTINFTWKYANGAGLYYLQISNDSTFADSVLFYAVSKEDTFDIVTNLDGLEDYFWRVKVSNIAGESDYSQTFKFTTGFPKIPVLLEPPHQTLNVSLTPELKWNSTTSASSYRLQLSETLTFNSATILLDTTISDTSTVLDNLEPNQIYFWRLAAVNQYGQSGFSSAFGFKTENVVSVEKEEGLPANYFLSQNYPNPFNPSTIIKFSLPQSGFTTLKIYDVLGNEISVLINNNLSAGNYTVNFDASDLSSGMYIYVLRSNDKIFTRKMMVLK